MKKYLVRRILSVIPVLLIMSFIVFMLIHMIPGDPARVILGDEATAEAVAELRRAMGLDDPLLVQYARWLGRILSGDLGRSLFMKGTMTSIIASHMIPTLQLTLFTMIIAVAVALPLGVLAAEKKRTVWDQLISAFAMQGISIPASGWENETLKQKEGLFVALSADLAQIRKELLREERRLAAARFLKNRLALTGLAVILTILLCIAVTPIIAPADPYAMNVSMRLRPPSALHWMGTDGFGRDLLSRVLHGARISMSIGFSVAFLSLCAGMVMGLYAAFYPRLDGVIMRLCDGVSAVPAILLAIAFMAVLGPSPKNVVLSLSMVYIPSVARIVRSRALEVKELTYIEAMRCLGASSFRVIWRHMAPNILSPVIVQTSFIFAKAIVTEAALSFLGVGVPVPVPSWGNILMEGKQVIFRAWWMILFPGAATASAVLGLNMLGDGLRDAMDQRLN